jgi:hypothetical protein
MSYELSTSDDDDLSSLELEDEDFYTDDLRWKLAFYINKLFMELGF